MRFKSHAGSNLIEMALVLPILLLVVFGIVEFSLMLYDKAMITNASREGARFAILYRTTRVTEAEVQAVVSGYVASRLITFGAPTAVRTTAPPPAYAPGVPYTVRVEYTYQYLVLPGFLGGGAGLNLVAQTTMRME